MCYLIKLVLKANEHIKQFIDLDQVQTFASRRFFIFERKFGKTRILELLGLCGSGALFDPFQSPESCHCQLLDG